MRAIFYWIYHPGHDGFLRLIKFNDKVYGRTTKFEKWGDINDDDSDKLSELFVINEGQLYVEDIRQLAVRANKWGLDRTEYWQAYAVPNTVEQIGAVIAHRGADFRNAIPLSSFSNRVHK